MTIKQKIGAAIATGTILAATLLPGAAFAQNLSCNISGNGVGSINTCKVKIKITNITVQTNTATVDNLVIAGASTGGNSANSNTGGSVTITGGNATVSVTVTNTLN